MKKIKVAFIYRSSNPYMSKKAWATTYYHFFMDALKRNEENTILRTESYEKKNQKD